MRQQAVTAAVAAHPELRWYMGVVMLLRLCHVPTIRSSTRTHILECPICMLAASTAAGAVTDVHGCATYKQVGADHQHQHTMAARLHTHITASTEGFSSAMQAVCIYVPCVPRPYAVGAHLQSLQHPECYQLR